MGQGVPRLEKELAEDDWDPLKPVGMRNLGSEERRDWKLGKEKDRSDEEPKMGQWKTWMRSLG